MDNRQARAVMIKQNRRKELDTLKHVYPGALSFESIRHVLPEIDQNHLKADLSYLIDKELIRWSNQSANQTWMEREYKLTAKGVETADAINLDPALEP